MKRIVWKDLDETTRTACLARPASVENKAIDDAARAIIADVRAKGDEALREYTARFDKVELEELAVSDAEKGGARRFIDAQAREAIERAYQNVKAFHEQQGYVAYSTETMPGVSCRRVVRPVDKVGLYVPGGTAPLVSTTLMLGIPAQIAGCPERVLCTPCGRDGKVNPYILYAAALCGIEKIFKVGGAQAIAAMAYGTQSIPKVYKIFGPGNAYVTAAKTLVAQEAGGAAIDMPAGPSEVCVIVDETSNPVFAAADLLSQAEHDTLSQVMLVTTSPELADKVAAEIERQLAVLPRRGIAAQALVNSLSIIAEGLDDAMAIANRYAPEHLILCFEGADAWLDKVQNAGSVFCGPWTPESAGDYASGTNHVLPTYGYARAYSGLGVEAFQRTMTVQALTAAGIRGLGPTVQTLARLEELEAHASAVTLRLAEVQ